MMQPVVNGVLPIPMSRSETSRVVPSLCCAERKYTQNFHHFLRSLQAGEDEPRPYYIMFLPGVLVPST